MTDEMFARIKETGYPASRVAYHREEIGGHAVFFWRSVFSEFLNTMVFQNAGPLADYGKNG